MTDRYAVLGNPIAHSKSPQIHALFAQQTNQDLSYEAILVPLDGFAQTISRLKDEGYAGCNVTVPFKLEAWRLANDIHKRAENAGAVNTLLFRDGQVFGDNTDGLGLLGDIQRNHGISLHGKRILLLGAGGAAQGVMAPLADAAPNLLVVANRTLDKAVTLKNKLSNLEREHSTVVQAKSFEELEGLSFDVVINATAASLTDTSLPLPNGLFAKRALAYDMMYGRETPFMKFAQEQGVSKVIDGLGMLVEQAAEAFYIWRGVRPETEPVMAALRASL